MADHAMCSFLTRTFLLVHDADKCPAHSPEVCVVATLGGHKGLIIFYGRNQVRPVVYTDFKSSTFLRKTLVHRV